VPLLRVPAYAWPRIGVSPLAGCCRVSVRHRRTPTPVAEPLAPANAPSSAAGEPPWPAVSLWSSCNPWAAARGPGGAQPSSPRGIDTRQGNARTRAAASTSGGGSLTHPPSRQRSRLETRAPVCSSRRVQCGAQERPCRAAAALAVPDLKRAPSNFSKSGRDGRRSAAAQHTHYGAVHRDAGQPRAMRSSSAPPGACSARSRAPHALSSHFSPILFPIFGKANSKNLKILQYYIITALETVDH